MTFTPSVQSKVDGNNSSATQLLLNESFTGAGTATTGYDTLIVTVETDVNSAAGGLEIQFSDDNVVPYQTFATDTVLATGTFTRTYLVIKKWYRVKYTTTGATATFNLTTRISTNLDSSITSQSNTINVFDNAAQAGVDAFGRARVSNPSTLLDIRFPSLPQNLPSIAPTPEVLDNEQQVNINVSSGFGWGNAGGYMDLVGTLGVTGYALSQSRTFITYQPGKSLFMLFSGQFATNDTYNTYIGLFDTTLLTVPDRAQPKTGVYLSFVDGGAYFNIANNGSVSSIAQSNWNVDKMDGTGPSGLTLDFFKTQLLAIDLEWLGVGRVRFGFYAFGTVQYCHQVTHLNVLTAPYTHTINLPVTYLLQGDAGSDGMAQLKQICSTVISEGGYTPVGRPFSANMGNNTTPGASQQTEVDITETPLLAIRGNVSKGYYHQSIIPTKFSVIDTDSNNTLLIRLRFYRGQNSSNVVATSWSSASAFSLVEYAQATLPGLVPNFTTFNTTGSIVLNNDYILGKGSNIVGDLSAAFTALLLNVSADESNTPDILLLTAQRVGAGGTKAKVWASIDWQEVY